MTSTTATDPNWDKIAAYLRHAFTLFGNPAALAQRLWLNARDHTLFSHFIRALEDAVRRLIFIAALDLAPMTLPPTPEHKFRARRAMPTNAGATFDPNKPESWRVTFKLSGPPASSRQPAPNAAHARATQTTAFRPQADAPIASAPSAKRLEALIRAYENRDKLAAALARKIARNARVAIAYITRRKRKRSKFPAYVTLDFTDAASEAHQRHLHRKLDAVLPDSS